MLARRLDPHCASGVRYDPECRNGGCDLLTSVVPTAPRPHHRYFRLCGHSSPGRHSQVHVQDCRHPQDTGQACHSTLLVTLGSIAGRQVSLWPSCPCLLRHWVISLTGCPARCAATQQGVPDDLSPQQNHVSRRCTSIWHFAHCSPHS